ncbi:MAG: inner-membrane translocator [Clostridiales Family XIII bacterium]|jgi:ribose transport system permease protein|nr:inner-membrane translocator [Clostridiales Family XIII bacterium]
MKTKLSKIRPFLSFGGLVVLVIAYLFVVDFAPSPFHIETIINQAAVMAVLSTGAVFIFSLGSFDISLGNAAGVAVCLGVLAYNAGWGIAGMFFVCVGVGIVTGLINSVLSAVFKLPVFIMTLAMMTVLIAILQILMDGATSIRIERSIIAPVKELDSLGFRLVFVVVFFAFCVVIFNYTKVGRKNKLQGGSPTVASQTGISVARQAIITFLISGTAVGISAFLMITRSQAVSNDTGTSLGMDVMMAIVFGGMPLSGGAYSKISSGVIGSFSMVLLSQIMTIQGATPGMSQIIKSALFLVVVFAASMNYREKMLSRAQMV